MVSHIRKGTIWFSVPDVRVFIDADSFDQYDCNEFTQGNCIDGENGVHHLKVDGVFLSNYSGSLPPAVESGYTVNGSWANHFNLWERTFLPNYTKIRIRAWPGTWIPYDTKFSTYVPPRYPSPNDNVDLDETWEVWGKVQPSSKYGYLEVAHGRHTYYVNGVKKVDESHNVRFPTIGQYVEQIDDDEVVDIKPYISNAVNLEVSKAVLGIGGLHDTLIREAIDAMPTLGSNNLDNVRQLYSLINDVVHKRIPEVPKTIPKLLASGWLQWRYSYNTTKLDVEDAKRNLPDLISDTDYIGRSRELARNVYAVAKLHVRDAYQDQVVARVYTFLDRWGLAPTWENLWDLVPFSFMVDWFTDWTDFAHEVHLNKRAQREYSIQSVVYSTKMTGQLDQDNLRCMFSLYDRNVSNQLVLDNDISWYKDDTTSNKTWIFRVIDGIALLMG